MPIDSSIPLQVQGPPPVTLNSLAQLSQMIRQTKLDRQNQQVQNSLLSIYRNPASLDANGLPTPDAVRQISAINPQMGMELRTNQAKLQSEQALTQQRSLEAYKLKGDAIHDAMEPALMAHDQAIQNGMSEQQAQAIGQREYDSRVENLRNSGLFSDQEKSQMPNAFDPNKIRAGSIKYKDWVANQYKDQNEQRADKRLDQQMKHEDAMEGMAARREGRMEAALMESKTGPSKDGSINGFSKDDIDILARKDLAGLPLNLSRGKSMDPVRRAITDRQLQIAREEGMDNDGLIEQMQQGKAQTGAMASATRAFATGKEGNTVRSLNVSMNHLDTLDRLTDALQNNDVPLVNKIANRFAQETGNTAPTNFDAAKQIIGDEIIKGIVGSGGTGADREKAQSSIDSAKTPAQLKGVISTFKDLMGGQLSGMEQQYAGSTGRKDFRDRYLSGSTKDLLKDNSPAAPKVGQVVRGYAYKGGDPASPSSWERQ